ncbi:MAG: hypothetical protein OHK0047_21870 [Leptolyngbyaceae cyanobacterium]
MESVPAISHAFEVAKQSKLSRKELELLEKRGMFLQDSRNALRKAEQAGEERGLQKGIRLGMQEKAKEIARQLLNVLDVETISHTTGLTIEGIQNLN